MTSRPALGPGYYRCLHECSCRLGYEVLQATRRFGALLFSTTGALVLMSAIAFQVNTWGVLSVGYAWVVSQIFYTGCVDTYSLNAAGIDSANQRPFLAAKVLYLIVPITYVFAMGMGYGPELGILGITIGSVALLQFFTVRYYRLFTVGAS